MTLPESVISQTDKDYITMESTIFAGIALHAVGGMAAATCYISQKGAPKWSWQTYWIVVCFTAWLLMPLVVSAFTIPGLLDVLRQTPPAIAWKIFFLGAIYGFGGMAFAVSIRYIGFSLTYAIAIGISAVFGTVVPAVISGTLVSNFQKPGGMVVLAGFLVSIVGVAICGKAGFMKESELVQPEDGDSRVPAFNMKKGFILVLIAGVLSGVFGVAVAGGVDIDTIATAHGAKAGFAGYAKYIFITGGTLLTNLVWWGVVCARKETFKEFIRHDEGHGKLAWYYLMGIVAGMLWFGQFIFYEQGHARMGNFGFVSWGIHMAMLIFFSFGVGLIFKEWNACTRKTLTMFAAGLLILVGSFGLITWGSYVGEQAAEEAGAPLESATVH